MGFDPDAYLAATAVQELPAKPAFDPDEYLRQTTPAAAFDPDKYLAATAPSNPAHDDAFLTDSTRQGPWTRTNPKPISADDLAAKKKGSALKGALAGTFLDQTPESLAALDVTGNARAGIDAQGASGINPGSVSMEGIKKLFQAAPDESLSPEPNKQPIITFPTPSGDTVPSGIVRGLANTASTLTTPENIGLLTSIEGAPAVVGKAAAAFFAGQMAHDLPEKIREIAESKTPGEAAQKSTEALAQALMIAGAGKKGLGRETVADAARVGSADIAPARVDPYASASEETPTSTVAPPETEPATEPISAATGKAGASPSIAEPATAPVEGNGAQAALNAIKKDFGYDIPLSGSPSAMDFETGKIKTGFGKSNRNESGVSVDDSLTPEQQAWVAAHEAFHKMELTERTDLATAAHADFKGTNLVPSFLKDAGRRTPKNKSESFNNEWLADNFANWVGKKMGMKVPSVDPRLSEFFEANKTKPSVEGKAATEGGVYPEPKETVGAQPIVPSAQALGVTHPLPGFLNSIVDSMLGANKGDQVRGLATRLKGFVGTITGETFPNTTLADRPSGELAARWISSRIAAPFVADNFSKQVLEGTGVDPLKFGTALTEDNLRSVRQGYEEAGKPDDAARVGSAIGGKNSPFKTEAEYHAFLKDPAVQKAIERHQALWSEVVDPMYKKAMMFDPDTELPSRGTQTGARINLHGIDPNEPVTNRNPVTTVAQGNPLGTLRKKSPFGRQATGTGTYNTDYNQMMANTFGRQLEIANKNAFETQLVKSGNAVIGKPGEKPILPDGEETVGFPLKRQTLVSKTEDGTAVIPQNQTLYVRKTIAPEYRRGANIDAIPVPAAIKTLGGVLNRAALAGLTDATVHITNLGTVLFNRPGVIGSTLTDSLMSTFGRADVPATMIKAVVKGFQDNRAQLTKLAEIGALRAQHEAGAKFNPLARMGDLIQWADKATRLVMDDTFTKLAKEGLVEDTETNRREFVNGVGQYNKRGQGDLMRLARDTGIGPFATAGRNFNVLAVKTLGLAPGAKATSAGSAAILRANMLSKWVGGAVLIGTANYLLTKDKGGGVLGRPGVKIGQIDTGNTDKNGRPLAVNAIDLLGLGRGLRATGLRGAIEAKRNGLTNADAGDSAVRDIYNTAISPFVGPVPKFVMGLANKTPSMAVGNPHSIVPPGENQALSNLKESLIDANPVVATIADLRKPGATTADAVRRQLPRFTLQPSNPPEMMEHYPEIVRKAQASAFVDDVIGRARKLEPEARKKFLNESLARLHDAGDREHAMQQFQRRRVWVQ